jgi:hypothetical protein
MSLSCTCDFDYYDYDSWWWEGPGKLQIMPALGRRKKCCACGAVINPGDEVFSFRRYRWARTRREEDIHGEHVPLAPHYTCEECSDLISAVEDLGMCYSLEEPLKDQVAEYMRAVKSYENYIKDNPEKNWLAIEDFIGESEDE